MPEKGKVRLRLQDVPAHHKAFTYEAPSNLAGDRFEGYGLLRILQPIAQPIEHPAEIPGGLHTVAPISHKGIGMVVQRCQLAKR